MSVFFSLHPHCYAYIVYLFINKAHSFMCVHLRCVYDRLDADVDQTHRILHIIYTFIDVHTFIDLR